MPGFNFGQIGDIIGAVMDTDFLDIFRTVSPNPQRVLLYANIPCHIAIISSDNPDPATADIAPVVTSLRIHMATWVDMQNGDFVVAKKMSHDNRILIAYQGLTGFPAMSQARQAILMQMATGAAPDIPIIPPPPLDPVSIFVRFENMAGIEIKAEMELLTTVGDEFSVEPIRISRNVWRETWIDNILQSGESAIIPEVKRTGHRIVFKYQEDIQLIYLRVLVNGIFTRNDGSIGMGFHLFRRIPIEMLQDLGSGVYQLRAKSGVMAHPNMGNITIAQGTKIKLYMSDDWVIVNSDPVRESDGAIVFMTQSFIPTEAEEQAYETLWYDE
jgi:hypothetical protein